MQLKVSKNRLIVKELPPKEVTKGGIVLPDDVRQVGTVWASVIKSGSEEYPVTSTVLFSQYAGVKFEFDNEDLLVIKSEDVLAWY